MKPTGCHNLSRNPNIRAIPTGPRPAEPANETQEQRLRRILNRMPAGADRSPGLMLKFLKKAAAEEKTA